MKGSQRIWHNVVEYIAKRNSEPIHFAICMIVIYSIFGNVIPQDIISGI